MKYQIEKNNRIDHVILPRNAFKRSPLKDEYSALRRMLDFFLPSAEDGGFLDLALSHFSKKVSYADGTLMNPL
jgi:hypothetical protein